MKSFGDAIVSDRSIVATVGLTYPEIFANRPFAKTKSAPTSAIKNELPEAVTVVPLTVAVVPGGLLVGSVPVPAAHARESWLYNLVATISIPWSRMRFCCQR